MGTGITYQSAVVFVKDIQASRNFYEDLLGQEVGFDFGENVSFTGGFAIHDANHISEIMFGRPAKDVDQLGRDNFELYFETGDLDTVLQRLTDANVPLVHPSREQPWGQRVFRCFDPDGHIVEVGEPMPVVIGRFLAQGMSAEEAAERTSMPLDIVRQIASSAG